MDTKNLWIANDASGKPLGNPVSHDMAVQLVQKQGAVIKRSVEDGLTQYSVRTPSGAKKIYFVVRQP